MKYPASRRPIISDDIAEIRDPAKDGEFDDERAAVTIPKGILIIPPIIPSATESTKVAANLRPKLA
jgi:hypothetical protein